MAKGSEVLEISISFLGPLVGKLENAIAISEAKAKGKERIWKIPCKLPHSIAGRYCDNK